MIWKRFNLGNQPERDECWIYLSNHMGSKVRSNMDNEQARSSQVVEGTVHRMDGRNWGIEIAFSGGIWHSQIGPSVSGYMEVYGDFISPPTNYGDNGFTLKEYKPIVKHE